MERNTTVVEIEREGGTIDICEVDESTQRVIRVVKYGRPIVKSEDREYQIGYAYACGYRD